MNRFATWMMMILAMSLLLATTAAALPIGPSAGIGIKGGLNLAKASDLDALADGKISNDTKTGLIGGAYGKFALGPINAQIEGLYSMKGSKGSLPLGLGDWETNLHYFEVPMLLKLELPLPAVGPYLYAGPTFSYLLKAENEAGDDISDALKSTEWGLAIGGGVNILQFNVEVRYSMGLTELLENDTAAPEFSALNDTKNRTISVMVGYDLLTF